MAPKIGVQLYSVREEMAKDFEGTVRRIVDFGVEGFETAGFPGKTPEEGIAFFKEVGLPVPSGHFPPPVGDQETEVLETAEALGCTWIVNTLGPDWFKDLDAIQKTCAMANEAATNAAAAGMRYALHNHWWEFEEIEGRLVFEEMLDRLVPEVEFQIDVYWVHVAGQDVVKLLERLGPRAPLLHMKDGPGKQGEPMLALGQGIMDVPAVYAAGAQHADWMHVELDACATDMMTAVKESIAKLKELRGAG